MASEVATTKQNGIQSLVQSPAIKARFDEVLGKRSPAFISSMISAVNANNQLKECNPMSVISSAMVAASLDLPINPSLGLAHIVPYKGTAQFQIGWKGFVQLALRSGQYKTLHASKILAGQIKKHNPFTGEMDFDHSITEGKIVGYLLYFKLLNGYEKFFYMTAVECDAHGKKYSASYRKGFGLWVDNFDAMAMKTVVKLGLSRYGILSIEMQKAFEMDQAEVTENGAPRYIDTEEVRQVGEGAETQIEKLNKKIRAKKAETKVENEIKDDGEVKAENADAHF